MFKREINHWHDYSNDTVCSLQCYNELKKIQDKKYYEEEIRKIPLKYRGIECDNKTLEQNFQKNIFINGKSGVGKTVFAANIAKMCIKNKIKFSWISFPQFIMELQNLYRKDNESPFERAESIAGFNGVLIIDDLGAEKATDWVRQITYFIINEREQRMLPIIITSNFSLEEIAEQIDIRISSRIAGMCKAIKLTDKDRRLDEKEKDWRL